MGDDKDGDYCTICGGMVPKGSDVAIITVDGKEMLIMSEDDILAIIA